MSTKKQHYIPRMILKNHTFIVIPRRHPEIYQYEIDKAVEREVRIDKICYKNNLYEMKDNDGNIQNRNLIENTLSCYERQWDRIIRKIEMRSNDITQSDVAFIYTLFSIQIMRMPLIQGMTVDWIQEQWPNLSNEESCRYAKALTLPLGQFDESTNILLAKWTELCCSRRIMVYISKAKDEPFILNREFPVTGIFSADKPEDDAEMYFPISSHICLGLINGEPDKVTYVDTPYEFVRVINWLTCAKEGTKILYSQMSIKNRIYEYPILRPDIRAMIEGKNF